MVYVDYRQLPAEGGNITLSLTKDDSEDWLIVVPQGTWYSVSQIRYITNFLAEIDLVLQPNTSGDFRWLEFTAGGVRTTELVSIRQLYSGTAVVSAYVVSVSPQGKVSASGGSITVDVSAVNGDDRLSSASVESGEGLSLQSTTHGVQSGGYLCTRFVFSWAANSSAAVRSGLLRFTVTDGSSSDTEDVLVEQAASSQSGGHLTLGGGSVTNAAGTLSLPISAINMRTSTIMVVSPLGFLTSQEVVISGNSIAVSIAYPRNTSTDPRTQTIEVEGEDIYGNTVSASAVFTQQGSTTSGNSIRAWWYGGATGVFDSNGGMQRALIRYTGEWDGDVRVTADLPQSVSIAPWSGNAGIAVTCAYGNIDSTLTIPILIERTGSDGVVYSTSLTLVLIAGGVYPIWRDVLCPLLGEDEYIDFEIRQGDSPIYSGRAFRYPNEQGVAINVSKICRYYLTDYSSEVSIVVSDSVIASYTFVRDYSYEDIDYYLNQPLNRPINGRIPQGFPMSVGEWSHGRAGEQNSLMVTDDTGSMIVNEVMSRGLNMGSWVSGAVGKRYYFGTEVFEVVDVCRGAVLRYLNALGAFDVFVVEGVCRKTDNISRLTLEHEAVAMSLQFERQDYQATMDAQWTGSTGWLTDAQSMRMRHLLESVEVYMIDSQTGDEVPILITLQNFEYKTFAGGRRMINYTIEWKESQRKIRR